MLFALYLTIIFNPPLEVQISPVYRRRSKHLEESDSFQKAKCKNLGRALICTVDAGFQGSMKEHSFSKGQNVGVFLLFVFLGKC